MNKRLVSTITVFLAGGFAIPVMVTAQSPTTIAVQAKLTAGKFRLRFRDSLPDVEAALASRFAGYLAQEVGYLRFAPGDTSSSYQVVFDLDSHERGTSAVFEEVGFWARLVGTAEGPLELYWLPFRPADQSSAGVGPRDQFLGAVEAKLAHADAGSLRDSLFRYVPIAEQALPSPNPTGWALTFTYLDLCIRNQSKLEFVNEVTVGAMKKEERLPAQVVSEFLVPPPPTSAVQPFLHGVFSEPVNQSDSTKLAQAINGGPLRVKEVFVVEPKHDVNACRDRGPGGGGQP